MPSVYSVNGRNLNQDDPAWRSILAVAYSGKTRPLCMCVKPGVEMYIARIEGGCIIKRMPNTGQNHAPFCESYVPPPELSGLGQVLGHAIQDNPEDGSSLLKLDFSLSKGANRVAPVPGSAEHDSVKSDGNKLTMRGLLHYLWEQAEFNRWMPQFSGKRNWATIRKYILLAIEHKSAKGMHLADIIYIPEIFNVERKEDIAQRRLARIMQVAHAQKAIRRLMIVIGEIKEISQARFGQQIILRHAPDFPIALDSDMYRKTQKRFANEISMWNAHRNDVHLMVIGTISINAAYVATFEELSLMLTNEHWLPIENELESMLMDALVKQERRFTKGLRYNLPSMRPLATAILTDTEDVATAIYIVVPGANEEYTKELDDLIAGSELDSVKWEPQTDASMPGFPPKI